MYFGRVRELGVPCAELIYGGAKSLRDRVESIAWLNEVDSEFFDQFVGNVVYLSFDGCHLGFE